MIKIKNFWEYRASFECPVAERLLNGSSGFNSCPAERKEFAQSQESFIQLREQEKPGGEQTEDD
jgi:hypothetical protein